MSDSAFPQQPSAPNAADRIGPVALSAQPSPVKGAAVPAPVAQSVAAVSSVQPTPVASPAPAASAQPQGADGQRTHVHSSYIWLGGLKTVVVLLFAVGVSIGSSLIGIIADEAFSSDDFLIMTVVLGVVAVGGLVAIGLVFLLTWWSWKHLYYQVGPDEFTLYSGIFNKKQVHVPYQRVQSVDQQSTLFQRIWGVCTVRIETAGGAANKAVVVPYVAKGQAEWLRRELFARKQVALAGRGQAVYAAAGASMPAAGVATPAPSDALALDGSGNVLDAPASLWGEVGGVFAGGSVETGQVSYEYGLSNRELVLTALSNNTAFVVVAIGLVATLGQVFTDVLPLLFGSEDAAIDFIVKESTGALGGYVIAAGVGAFVVAALVIWLVSALSTCLSYGGFKARRRDSRIEVERGLLQHQFSGVDVDRVQSVVIRQSFVRRLMGYCELSLGKVDSAAGENEKGSNVSTNGLVIHPFVKLSRVPSILRGIIPEFADVPTDPIPVAPVALRRAILRRGFWQGAGFWCAVVGGLCVVFAPAVADALGEVPSDAGEVLFAMSVVAAGLLALGAVLFVIEVVSAVLWARESSFAFNHHFMQVKNGGLSQQTTIFPRKKIQFAYTRTNPFQRLARTATIVVATAAGVGGTNVSLIDAKSECAQEWLEWVKPGGNR